MLPRVAPVVGILIVLLLVGVYITFFKDDTKTSDVVHSVLDTSEWTIYDNKEYGYRFKYPENLEVLDGADPRYKAYDLQDATFIIFPGKYPNIKSPDVYNPDSFLNYEINITKRARQTSHESERSDVRVYQDDYGNEFVFVLEGMNPEYMYTREWLKAIDNQQLIEWVGRYPEYLKILDGIYRSFEVYRK